MLTQADALPTRPPIALLSARLIERGELSAADVEALRAAAHDRIEAAAQFAAQSPFPSVEELLTDVYA